jgi:hypothetical protein
MQEFHKLVARIDPDHWILLSPTVRGDEWTFLIWGTYPLTGKIGSVSESEAKIRALSTAREHLEKHGLKDGLAEAQELPWRVAVRYEAA